MSDNPFPGLPPGVAQVILNAVFTEFATMTAKGVPLDTPLFCFRSADGRSIDVATGLAYPAKAERARRNPKVGLLLEGGPGQPIVSISAMAAVRDADIQANALRYIAETIPYVHLAAGNRPWSVLRNAVWYWSRILVFNTPRRILWWPNAESTDQSPRRWDAPADSVFPVSDPAPAAAPSTPASWPVKAWAERAREILGQGMSGHLTLVGEDDFPLPFRTRGAMQVDDGFILDVPAGAPWKIQGQASLCFNGMATFIGTVEGTHAETHLKVERMMPDLPLVQDNNEIWEPKPATHEKLMERLQQELSRRGQSIPKIPEKSPQPTPGGLTRGVIMEEFMKAMAAQAQH